MPIRTAYLARQFVPLCPLEQNKGCICIRVCFKLAMLRAASRSIEGVLADKSCKITEVQSICISIMITRVFPIFFIYYAEVRFRVL